MKHMAHIECFEMRLKTDDERMKPAGAAFKLMRPLLYKACFAHFPHAIDELKQLGLLKGK